MIKILSLAKRIPKKPMIWLNWIINSPRLRTQGHYIFTVRPPTAFFTFDFPKNKDWNKRNSGDYIRNEKVMSWDMSLSYFFFWFWFYGSYSEEQKPQKKISKRVINPPFLELVGNKKDCCIGGLFFEWVEC